MHDEEDALISPGEFIPLLEQSGAIIKTLGWSKGAFDGYTAGFLIFAGVVAVAIVGLGLVKTRWRTTWGGSRRRDNLIPHDHNIRSCAIICYNTLNHTFKDSIMTVSASEVRVKGVSLFDQMFEKFGEVIINVRGKNKYCVVPFEEYEAYRAYQLDRAYNEVTKEIEEGRFHTDPQQHFATLEAALSDG